MSKRVIRRSIAVSTLAFCLINISPVRSLDLNNKTITSGVVLAAALGVGAYYAWKKYWAPRDLLQVKKINNGGLQLFIASDIRSLCSHSTRERYNQRLSSEPSQLMSELFAQTMRELILPNQQVRSVSYEQFCTMSAQNPFLFISECVGKECMLSRVYYPEFRKDVEDKIIEHIIKQFPDRSAPITLTSFASGGLFGELLLCQKLIDSGYFNLCINLIDTEYGAFMRVANHLETIKKDFKLTSTLLKELGFTIQDTAAADSAMKALIYRFVQFLANLPQQVTVNIFQSARYYLQACQKEHSLLSDAIIAIDFYDGDKTNRDAALLQYYALLACGLKPDCTAYALCNNVALEWDQAQRYNEIVLQKYTHNNNTVSIDSFNASSERELARIGTFDSLVKVRLTPVARNLKAAFSRPT